MTLILLSFVIGFAVGLPMPDDGRLGQFVARSVSPLVYAVVLVQGALLGASDTFATTWGSVLWHGVVLAVAVSAAVLVGVELVGRLVGQRPESREVGAVEGHSPWAVLPVLAALVSGTLFGAMFPSLVHDLASWVDVPLLLLLAAIGADMGRQRRAVWQHLVSARAALWIAPTAVVCAGLAAWGACSAMPYGVAPIVAGGLGSGFYSVAGPVITDLHGPEAGGVVLLGNLLREWIGMVLIPMLPRFGFSVASAAGLGGATGMDTTLPFLVRGFGARGAVSGLAVGLVLTLAVPVLVPLVYRALFLLQP